MQRINAMKSRYLKRERERERERDRADGDEEWDEENELAIKGN